MLQLEREVVGIPNPPRTLTLYSEVLGETRRIYLQLPDDHALTDRSYPVLLVLDGEWNFSLARSHVQFYSEFAAMGVEIPKMIVVGIENLDRDVNYVPTPDRREEPQFPTAGKADEFLNFLSDELFPYLETHYRAAPNRTIAGWSFGGLFACHAAATRPELFHAYLCIGPSLWWDDNLPVKAFEKAAFDRPTRMVLTLGAEEVDGAVYDSTKALLAALATSPIANLDITHLEFEGVGHGGGVPLAFARGLRALFPGFRMQVQPETRLKDVESYYAHLSEQWGFDVLPSPWVLQTLASNCWGADLKQEAIAALDWFIDRDPNDALTHAYKGIYLSRLEDTDAARSSLSTALDLELSRDVPSGVYLRGIRKRLEEISPAGTQPSNDRTTLG